VVPALITALADRHWWVREEAVTALREAAFRVIVVTNQPDVGKGVRRRELVEAMHERLRRSLPLDGIKACYHTDQDHCHCRKPKPGMLLEAATEWDLDLSRCVMVGDRWRDIEAGKAAGCRTMLVRSSWAEPQAQAPDAVVASLREASRLILSQWMSQPSHGAAHAKA
jgi:D-glycero-D-manno-heptose 1,7-bisphosphate phosphatase